LISLLLDLEGLLESRCHVSKKTIDAVTYGSWLAIRLFHTDEKNRSNLSEKALASPAKEPVPKIARCRPRSTADASSDRWTPAGDGSYGGASRGANGPAAERALLTRRHTSTSRHR
jgi:hypothetical protein